ncbi:T9SS type A sorting domain-containing protein [Owenweeksia hongkongensis]|uniref:T9SS type A sorting domain-containing protein n=1 Tax=Owenweeksia hongkongensis TaxID=253245 RepID=UPI003A8EB29B
MKRLLPLLLFAITLSANAQNYELFPNPSDTLAFEDTHRNVIFISFDSISTDIAGTNYWPHSETSVDYSSTNPNCIGHIVDTAWVGYKIEKSGSSVYTFRHNRFEFTIDINNINTSPDSIGWAGNNNHMYTVRSAFAGKSFQTIYNGTQDSVLSFNITAIDTNGSSYIPTSSIPLKIEVSKNYGLTNMTLLGSDFVGYYIAPYRNLKRISPYKLFTRGDMFNFEVGDVFHYRSWSSTVYGPKGFPKNTNNTIIGKTLVKTDSILYTIDQKWETSTFDYQTMSIKYVLGRDTLAVGYGRLTELFSDQLTFQSDTITIPYSWTTSFWLNDTLGRSGICFVGDLSYRRGNCIEIPFEPSPKENTYITGIGLISSYEVRFPALEEKYLVYFKKTSGQTWGSPYNISIEELAQQRPLKIYPNPASNVLSIELPDGVQQMEITIIDKVGRTLLKESITKEKSGISVEALSPGTYFIRTNKGSAVPFVKR